MAYGAISASTILPVVAAVTGGDYAALVALGGVAGSVGGNLIANQIQKWHDKDEAQLAAELGQLAEAQPEWRDALDALILELETPRVVQAVLGEKEWDRFQRLLREELAKLGNEQKYEIYLTQNTSYKAEVSGSGAVAQGGSVAAGQGGAAVGRDNYGGVHITNPPPPDPIQVQADKARERYLQRIQQQCNVLPLAPLGGEEGSGDEVTLEQIYVALDTQTRAPLTEEEKKKQERTRGSSFGSGREGDESRPLSALEAATQHHRLALLGDPGSGKSTFVRQLVAWIAEANLGERPLPSGWHGNLLPLLTVLRELAPLLAEVKLNGLADEERNRRLVAAVWRHWETQLDNCRARALADSLGDALDAGTVFLVFDGLDEVPVNLRPHVRLAVSALIKEYPNVARVIVTCRTRSYVGETRFPHFQEHRLAPFDEEKIKGFVAGWYEAQVRLGRYQKAEVSAKIDDLRSAALSKSLSEISSNPMLLTTMSIIHQREVGLPRERVRLYSLAVQVLISRWQTRKGITLSKALTDLLADDLKLRTILERLAYEAHRQKQDGEADLPRKDLLVLLEQSAYLGEAGLAAEFLDYVDQRAGLLVGKGGDEQSPHPAAYAFPHRTFQEYLAGCYLVSGRGIHRTYWEKAGEGDFWYLAAMLGAEDLLYNRRNPIDLLDLIYALCPVSSRAYEQGWRADGWSGQMASTIGLETIMADQEHPEGGSAYLERLRSRLLQVMRESTLTPIERAEAGRSLARLGDPRVEVLEPLAIEFCPIPPGEFWMGEGKEEHLSQSVDYPFQISRYPITQAQYGAFVEAGGYALERYWPEAIARKVWRNGQIKGFLDNEPRDKPENFNEPFMLANHPVVGVTWYEALAFTRWLTGQMRAAGRLSADQVVTLPSEAEWEKAARAGDRRVYPWDSSADPNRANYDDSGIGSTSAVGCFPGGASPYEVEELSGNVWEWTRSLWGDDWEKPEYIYPYDPADGRESLEASDRVRRVLRGGAFDNNEDSVRCAYRNRYHPYSWSSNIGIRVVVVVSPFTSGL
jgi:formylglycine-generating enzyme required for sulfatase activity